MNRLIGYIEQNGTVAARPRPSTYEPPYEGVRDPVVVRFKKLVPEAVTPRYAHGPEEDAAMDLSSCVECWIEPGGRKSVPTGISVELPAGYWAEVRPRGGLSYNYGIMAHVGTIDPGYRGEIMVILYNHGDRPFQVSQGMRIAQLLVSRYSQVVLQEADELSDSDRGEGRFSSTGLL